MGWAQAEERLTTVVPRSPVVPPVIVAPVPVPRIVARIPTLAALALGVAFTLVAPGIALALPVTGRSDLGIGGTIKVNNGWSRINSEGAQAKPRKCRPTLDRFVRLFVQSFVVTHDAALLQRGILL